MGFVSRLRMVEKSICMFGTVITFLCVLLTSADVFLRHAFKIAIPSASEICAVSFTGGVFLTMAYTYAEKRHINVEVVTSRLSPRLSFVLEIIVALLGLFLCILFVWGSGKIAIESVFINETVFGAIAIPLWPAKVLFPIGMFILFLAIVVSMIDRIRTFKKSHNFHVSE